jgi:diacylglycerol O-acyltransferase
VSSTDTGTGGPGRRGSSRFARLSPFERMYVRLETPDWPGHVGGLAVLAGGPLLDASGQLRLAEIRDRLERRLLRVPRLRQRVLSPRWPGGRPLWVDDDRFAIEHHVRRAAVPSPGGEAQLLETAAEIYGRLLDRRRPLWELWFLTGLDGGRLGALLKLHHAMADGTAAVAVMGSLFDLTADAPDPTPVPWEPEPIPGGWSLVSDNLAGKARTVGRGMAALAQPGRLIQGARVVALVARRSAGVKGAPRTSLGFLGLDLASVKEAAHAHGGKVNDVVLALWAGGLRELLVSRGEPVVGVEPTVGMAVSTRSAGDAAIDNQVGTVVLPLPVGEADPTRRLDLVVARTARAKDQQRSAAIMGALVGLTATPLGRYLLLRQRATSVMATNVTGPPVPVYVLGARILDILPIIDLEGNIGLTVCAFSYAGRLFLVVTADVQGFPDLDVLMGGMERDWRALGGGPAAESASEGPVAG